MAAADAGDRRRDPCLHRARPAAHPHDSSVYYGPPADPAHHSRRHQRHRASRAGPCRCHERPSGRSYSAPLRGDADAPPWRQPCRCRRGAPAPRSDDDDALRQGGLRAPLRDCPALGGKPGMLIDDIERYLALRRSLGFKLEQAGEYLGSFAALCRRQGRRSHPRANRHRVGADGADGGSAIQPAQGHRACRAVPARRRRRP